MFSYVEERLESAMLDLAFHINPWDRPAFPGNTATLSSIRLSATDLDAESSAVFDAFRAWCADNDVRLVDCRLAQDRLTECAFLEARGFRFIELNYQPVIGNLGRFADDPDITIVPALPSDAAELAAFVAEAFDTGRLLRDPQVDAEIGRRRYAAWVLNAFDNPAQRVVKYLMGGRVIGCYVVGQPVIPTSTWSLFSLVPGLAGKGLGQRCCKALLALHHREGIKQILGSVSSLNPASFNMLVSVGFRVPSPEITLHWCPFGPVRLA